MRWFLSLPPANGCDGSVSSFENHRSYEDRCLCHGFGILCDRSSGISPAALVVGKDVEPKVMAGASSNGDGREIRVATGCELFLSYETSTVCEGTMSALPCE